MAAALALFASAAPAMAGINHELAVFSDCPLSNPTLGECAYSTVDGGEFVLGSKTVPINKTIVLQGGLKDDSLELVPAADGNTLSHTPLTVPGGFVGLGLPGEEVTATAELAGGVELNSTALLRGSSGTGILLPLKVKLDNPLGVVLGANCLVGSNAEPIGLQLTSGTTSPPPPNKPISGKAGTITFPAAGNIVLVSGTTIVDNSFAAPAASGCGAVPALVDPVVNSQSGLPAAAGTNTAIQNITLELAFPERLKAQAKLPAIGRCVPASPKHTGAYGDPKCVSLAGGAGKYEWLEGPGTKPNFSATGKNAALQGVGGGQVNCTGSKTTGTYTGAKALTASISFTGCKLAAGKAACQSTGAAPGKIDTSPLAGQLGFIQDEAVGSELLVSVGVDLSSEPSLIQAECAGLSEALVVKGSMIGSIGKLEKGASSFSLAYKASSGKQAPEQFEEGAKDTLTATLGSGAEQAGLTTTEAIKNGEKLEIKAIQR